MIIIILAVSQSSCDDVPSDKIPIVLIHGFLNTKVNMRVMEKEVKTHYPNR